MTAAPYALELADALDAAAIREVRRIYEDGFPPWLRADFGSLTDHREPGDVPLALMDGDQPRGFAIGRPLGGTGWWYLRYFVVASQLRGQGLGAVMWELLSARLRAADDTVLVLDVADPAEPGCAADEVAIRVRRIRFYQRQGADVLPVHGYRTPAGAGEPWTPMLLLAATLAPLAPLSAGPPPVSENQAQAIAAAVYRYRWKLEPGHPQMAATGAGVPDGARLAAGGPRTGEPSTGGPAPDQGGPHQEGT
jgi:GNAT superfamily N-acetyltransferase